MDFELIFYRIKYGVDQFADVLISAGSPLSPTLVRFALYVLVFVAHPLLILVSLPWGLGIFFLVAVAEFLICGAHLAT